MPGNRVPSRAGKKVSIRNEANPTWRGLEKRLALVLVPETSDPVPAARSAFLVVVPRCLPFTFRLLSRITQRWPTEESQVPLRRGREHRGSWAPPQLRLRRLPGSFFLLGTFCWMTRLGACGSEGTFLVSVDPSEPWGAREAWWGSRGGLGHGVALTPALATPHFTSIQWRWSYLLGWWEGPNGLILPLLTGVTSE